MTELIIKRKNNIYYRSLILNVIILIFVIRNISDYYANSESTDVFLVISYILGFLLVGWIVSTVNQIMKGSTALTVSDLGITDNSSILKPGLVHWSNIKGAEVKNYKGALQLMIYLHDYDMLIHGGSKIRDRILNLYIREVETPWVINTRVLNTDIAALHAIILEKVQSETSALHQE